MDVMGQQQRHGRDVCQCVYKTVYLPCLGHHEILRIRLHSFYHHSFRLITLFF